MKKFIQFKRHLKVILRMTDIQASLPFIAVRGEYIHIKPRA